MFGKVWRLVVALVLVVIDSATGKRRPPEPMVGKPKDGPGPRRPTQ